MICVEVLYMKIKKKKIIATLIIVILLAVFLSPSIEKYIQNIHKIEPVLASNSYEKHLTKAEEYYTNNDYDIVNYFATSIGTLPDASCSIEDYNYLVNKYYTHQ